LIITYRLLFENFQIWELQRKSDPNSGQYSSQIDQIQTDLSNAQSILTSVGTSKYQGTQQIDVWNALHDANNIIKQLWGELNGHQKKSTSSTT